MSKLLQTYSEQSPVQHNIPIYGHVHDVTAGKLVEVPEATVAGKAA